MPFNIKTLESILSGDKPDLDRTILTMVIGERGSLNRKGLATAVLAWRALKITPTTAIVLLVGGYDDDPRELWQIPEVRTYVQKFCAKTEAHKHRQVEPQSRNWLILCGADPTLRPECVLISNQESSKRTIDFFKQVIKQYGEQELE